MSLLLRSLAVAVAIAGIFDPALTLQRRQPIAVDIRLPPGSDPGHAAALAQKEDVLRALDGIATVDSPDVPQAFIVIGNGALPARVDAPVFVVPTASPAVTIRAIETPSGSVPGQSLPITASLHARGTAGRTTVVRLLQDGLEVDRAAHPWQSNDANADIRLTFVATSAGLHRVRVLTETPGEQNGAVADAAVTVRDRSLRVLAYEPRPSWALGFVRRSLEADPLFAVHAVSRTSARLSAIGAGAPTSLAALDPDSYDVILAGAADALSEADLSVLDRFATLRGGQVVLIPDRRLPDRVRDRLGLPAMEERLLQRPVALTAGELRIRASEFLLAPGKHDHLDVVASLEDPAGDRPAIISVDRGDGRVIVSGLLDAWRFRGDAEDHAFDRFWRSLVADVAVQSPPRLGVEVEPALVRPRDAIRVTATWRRSELQRSERRIEVPRVSASMVAADGRREFVRLWPGIRPGVYEAIVPAPAAGRYVVSVTGESISVEATLRVHDDVVQAVRDRSAAAAFTAAATRGAVVEDVETLRTKLEQIDRVAIEQVSHPMRSGWWIVPFAGLLCAEWALRRRRGLP